MVTERDKAGNRLGPEGFKQMTNQQWSDQILVVEMGDDPQFTDKLSNLTERLERNPSLDVVLNMGGVNQIYSSNIAQLLRVRAAVIANERRLFLAEIRAQVWDVLQAVRLDEKFDTADEVAIALRSLQMKRK